MTKAASEPGRNTAQMLKTQGGEDVTSLPTAITSRVLNLQKADQDDMGAEQCRSACRRCGGCAYRVDRRARITSSMRESLGTAARCICSIRQAVKVWTMTASSMSLRGYSARPTGPATRRQASGPQLGESPPAAGFRPAGVVVAGSRSVVFPTDDVASGYHR